MTFWTDAKPATPRFRLRRRHRPGGGRRPGRAVAVALVIGAMAVASSIVVVRAGGEPASTAAATPARAHVPRKKLQVVPASWSATLPDYPQSMLADARGVIVIGSDYVSQVDGNDGDSHWRSYNARLNIDGALRGNTILVSTKTGFVAMDRVTGRERWRTDTPETPEAVALVGPAGTPAVAVVSTQEGGLVGLDVRTGKARWSVRFPGYIGGVPAPDDASGLVATVWRQDDGGHLRMIDASTGAVTWERPIPLMSGSPVVVDRPGQRRRLMVGAGNGDYDSEVRAYDLLDGTLLWRAPVPASFQPSQVPLADGDALFVMDQLSNVTRLDLATGARRWTIDTGSIATEGSPVRAGDSILVTNLTDDVFTLDRANGAIRARRRTVGFPTRLLVTHGRVLIAQRLVEERHLQAFPASVIAKSLPGSARKPG